MCWCRPEVWTPCCGRDACHVAGKLAPGSTCPWCRKPVFDPPVKLFTVFEMWTDYLRLVIPRDAGPTQIQECRRAFYAGAHAMYTDCALGIGDPSTPMAVGEAHLEAIRAELDRFKQDVLKGKG